MKPYRSRLPPLDTLIFFEAVSRFNSFTVAAEELMVSQAAVSKRIRQLEDWLGVILFERKGKKLQPTSLGTMLGEQVSSALDFLSLSLEELRLPHPSQVRIGAMTVIGMFWLQPRLSSFALSDKSCTFSLTLSDKMATLLSSDFDLLIIYGDGKFSGWQAKLLIKERLVPVASPQFVQKLAKDNFKQPITLLEYQRQSPEWVNWQQWQQKCQLPFAQEISYHHCASYAQSIGMALQDKGVALGNLPILQEELKQGRLKQLGKNGLTTGRGYWLAKKENVAFSSAMLAIWNALLEH